MSSLADIANDPELRKQLKMGGVRLTAKMMAQFNTEDANLLNRRLEGGNPTKDLERKAEILLKQEGTLTPYSQIDPVRIRAELEMIINPEVRASDVRAWVRECREELEKLSTLRLNWLWDFSWCYFMHPKSFLSREFLIYGAIRGNPPVPSKNIPYQSALNYLRKTRKQKRDRKIYSLSKQGDLEGLMEMGFTREVAQHAITKVARVSG